MKIKNSVRTMRSAKFWIDGVTYNIGKGKIFKKSDIKHFLIKYLFTDTQNTKNFKTETAEGKISTKFRLPT